MARKADAPTKPRMTVEQRLEAKKKRAEAEAAAVQRLEQAIKDRPNLEAEVMQAEKNLAQWEAAGSGFKEDLRRKRQALSDCKQLLHEPVRAKKAPAGQPPTEAAAPPQDEASRDSGAPGEEAQGG